MDEVPDSNHARASDVVRLSLPGSLEYVRVARMTAAALAARLRFDVEEIEDLRVAVDELVSVVIDGATGGEVDVEFSDVGGQFVVTGRTPARDPLQLDELTRQILGVVVDEFTVGVNDGVAEFRAAKRPAST